MECKVLETYAQYSYFVCSQLRKHNKMEGKKLKHPNAEMASSSSAVTSPFEALPDEIVLKIIKMAAPAAWDVDE